MQTPKLKWSLTILTLLIALTIFLLSSKTGTESREDSNFFSLNLVDKLTENYDELASWQQFRAEENLDELIRKLAHVCEFAGLSFFLRLTLESWFGPSRKTKKAWKLSLQTLLGGFLYACTDEIHQIFVPGRSAGLRDILIDTAGVTLGLIAVLFFLWLIRNKLSKEETLGT